jgi:hypothetical protein
METEFQNFQNFRIEKKAGVTWFLVISTIEEFGTEVNKGNEEPARRA